MTESEKLSENTKSNFYPAFLLLEKDKKHALSIIYAFAKDIDDIADNTILREEEKRNLLNIWKNKIEEIYRDNPADSLSESLAWVIKKFNIEKKMFLELINGVSRDLDEATYNTFEDLKKYMYQVAVIPGLITLDILEYKGEHRQSLAENLGYAVQLTNIIRDIYEDAKIDRFYIPSEDMKRFDISSDYIKTEKFSENFYNMMLFEYNRAKELYSSSLEILSLEKKEKLKLPLAMAIIYKKLLDKIRRQNFDIRKKIPKINKLEGMIIILKVYFNSEIL